MTNYDIPQDAISLLIWSMADGLHGGLVIDGEVQRLPAIVTSIIYGQTLV